MGLRGSWLDAVSLPVFAILNSTRNPDDEKYKGYYRFWDANAKLTHRFSPDNTLTLGFYMGRDNLGFGVSFEEIDGGLDIGTGTGLVGIMLSQRCPQAIVTGVEIDADAAKQAEENATSTGWKIKIINKSIQDFSFQCEEKFDLIVSNPPYFINSLKAPEKNRNTARHTDELSYEELIESAEKLLSEEGKFSVIIPYSEEENFIGIANKRNLVVISNCH